MSHNKHKGQKREENGESCRHEVKVSHHEVEAVKVDSLASKRSRPVEPSLLVPPQRSKDAIPIFQVGLQKRFWALKAAAEMSLTRTGLRIKAYPFGFFAERFQIALCFVVPRRSGDLV